MNVQFEGQTHQFPDDATPDEIRAVLSKAKPVFVLREQPSRLEESISPGGIASPENVGIIGGGLTGALYGAPFAPPFGAAVGGLLGAGGGALLGRGGEMLKEKFFGPYRTPGTEPLKQPKRTFTEVAKELGEASERGITAQALGEVGGAAFGKVLAPFAPKLSSEAKQAAATAKKYGIGLTAAETFDSGLGSRVESVPGRSLFGASKVKQFAETRSEQAATAMRDFADSLSPGLAKDYETVGSAIKDIAENRLQGLSGVVRQLSKKVSGGKILGLKEAGETVKEAKDTLLEALKGKASNLYDAVKTAAGDQASQIKAPEFRKIAAEILGQESKMSGVQLQSAGVAGGASRQFPKPKLTIAQQIEAAQKTGEQAGPTTLSAELASKFGLDKEKMWDLDTLREWQSRLGDLYSSVTDRKARRDFARMFSAVSNDIKTWGEGLDPNVNELLKTANGFYKNSIADVYFNRLVSGIDKAEPDMVAHLFLGPNVSAVALDRVKKAIGADAFNKASGAYLDDLMRGANNIDGSFSPIKALRLLDTHDPEVIKRLYGKYFNAEQAVVKMFQRNPNKMIEGIMGKDADKIIPMLVPKDGSVESLSRMRMLLPTKTYDQVAGAILKKTVEDSSPGGVFSFDRFLTQVNSKIGYNQGQLRSLLGDQYGQFREMVDLFERIRRNQRFSINTSGTVQGAVSIAQLTGLTGLAGNVAINTLRGTEDPITGLEQLGTGLAILSPAVLGKVIYSKGGIKWLTEGLTAAPGSREGVTAISSLMAILANPKLGVVPEKSMTPMMPPPKESPPVPPIALQPPKKTPAEIIQSVVKSPEGSGSPTQTERIDAKKELKSKIGQKQSVDSLLKSGRLSGPEINKALREREAEIAE